MASSSSFSGLTISCIVVMFLCVAVHLAYGTQDNKPVLFIFGDSTADVGTNNYLHTTAKANVSYYGIDFANSQPTGRFSNGFNTIDYIAQEFGYVESPPPYFALQQDPQYNFSMDVVGGANFASGGSGILRDTGKHHWGEVIHLELQVKQFEVVRTTITETLGETETATFLSNSLFIISVGANDLLEFNDNETAVSLGQQEQYLSSLQSNYSLQIMNLYALGARRFGIIGVAAIGCCPAMRAKNGGKCADELNQLANVLNSVTSATLQKISYMLKEDFKYSFGDSLNMTLGVLKHPGGVGIKETKKACCGVGNFNGEDPCLQSINANLCANRTDYLFWDWFHPTEKASFLAAWLLCNGSPAPGSITPINFRQLAQN